MPSNKEDHKLHVAVAQLLLHLPECVHGYYWETGELQSMLERGGFAGLPEGLVTATMRSERFLASCTRVDVFDNVKRYMFGAARNGISCYADQISLASCSGCGCSITIAQDYFNNASIAHPQTKLARAVETVKNHCQKHRHKQGPGSSNSLSETNQDTGEQSTRRNQPTVQKLSTAGSSSSEAEKRTSTSSTRHGLQIVDLDQEAEFINAVQDHAIHCKHKLAATQEPKKIGFDLGR